MKKDYYCGICGKWFNGEPHTDPSTEEDCHEKCCPVCHPMRGQHKTLSEKGQDFVLFGLLLFFAAIIYFMYPHVGETLQGVIKGGVIALGIYAIIGFATA